MPRPTFIPSDVFPYHVSARTHNKKDFEIPLRDVWAIYEDYLFLLSKLYGVETVSFVLMSNHFHWIVRTPQSNLAAAANYFMRETSKEIGRLSDSINQTYGSAYYRSLIKDDLYFQCAYKYVYRNPVAAGLAVQVEDHPFSTLGGLLGLQRLIIPVLGDTLLFSSPEKCLSWLNQKLEDRTQLAIRRGIRRATFEVGKECRKEVGGDLLRPCLDSE